MMNRTGAYSVASGYSIAFQFNLPPLEFLPEQCHSKPLCSSIWNLKSQPKIRSFIWKLLHDALPVKLKVSARIETVNSTCPRCGSAEESVHHCLWFCTDSLEAWHLVDFPVLNPDEHLWRC
ncbi:hypothetical protein Ahy_B06g080311 [Arachis hypogaea]|uniref:Reverse transcriptase zinc-binding domain-containing protein n=1 Tax=Arachis hypogaea TaxID=3818 RepID=A0A444YHS4_ARAHY|nr:hypothetical protein Ahy_B06g080311 [Arachis hypogaea]